MPLRTTQSTNTPPVRDSLLILAHELRNPLMLIRTEVALLRRQHVDRPSVAEGCAIIDQQLNQLSELIRDVAGVATPPTGAEAQSAQPLDVRDLLKATADAVTGLAIARSVHLEIDTGAHPLMVCGNAVRLTQALTNLMTNAAKFTDSGGAIIVVGRREGDWNQVSIRDTGRGMSADSLRKLFDPPAGLTVAPGDGSGIGLAVAQQVIRAHRGTLVGKSDGVGLGSEFVIRLPAAASAN
jgi:signal transduction histidine kinase